MKYLMRIIYFCGYVAILLILLVNDMFSQQIKINRVEQMPNSPAPYLMRDWKQVARGYDSLVYDLNATGQYLPLIFINNNTVNYPEHKSFGLHTVVGTPNTSSGEAINVLPSVVGASLVGIDKSNQNGYNWVLMCEEYFNRRPSENVYLNSPNTSSGDDWWYETMPNVFFYQLYSMYPNTGDFNKQFTTVAGRWLQAVNAMGGRTTPWRVPNMNYRAWKLSTMTPNPGGVIEPEASGAIAWILYSAYLKTGEESYRIGAELSMEFLNGLSSNPAYELQLPYGVYTAARMNAELGTRYDIQKLINWCFDITPLRSWGAILGNWGGYDVSGLIGEVSGNDYAFIMNNFEQAGALVPLVRYDKRFARAIGKWVLNAANAARLFYPKYLPQSNQDSYEWAQKYDPESYIAHEAIRKVINGKTPFATGDAISGGWGNTTLSLYSSSHVGIFGGIIDTTNIEKILRLDLLKTDYFHGSAYPSYLYYNPYGSDQLVEIETGSGVHDIYDAVSGSFIKTGVSGKTIISVPADGAVIAVLTPGGGKISYELNRMLVDGVVIDYQSNHAVANYPPRIKSLSADSVEIVSAGSINLYCTASDPESDTLTYSWIVPAGKISGSGQAVSWTAPAESNKYLLTCIVSDIYGNKDTASITIEVVKRLNHPPVIMGLKASPGKVDLGGMVTLSCNATDADNDTLSYSWKAVQGTINGSGKIVAWQAPSTKGNYYIMCTVSDPMGASVSDSVGIEVRDLSAATKGDLILYLPFSGNANDASGRNHNGVVYGATLTADRTGNANNAYYFNGQDNFILVANDTSLNFKNAITIGFWMKPAVLFTREAFLVSHGSWQNRYKASITDKRVRWTIKTSTGTKDLDSRTVLSADSVYYVTAVYDGSDIELYINGELDAFSNYSGTILTTTYDITIGQMLPGDKNYNFSGMLDEIRLYNYALTPDEIQKLYASSTGTGDSRHKAPWSYSLMQNYPNPFNPGTVISYQLPVFSHVRLAVYDVLGREIAVLFEGDRAAGIYSYHLNANEHSLTSGVYFYRLSADGQVMETRKMVLLK